MGKFHLFVLALGLGCLVVAAGAARTSAPEIEDEFQKLAKSRNAWPGFEPMRIPLAVYDGSKTHFFRHPLPLVVMEGRHPAVTSNSSAEIDGVMTATLMADGDRGNLPAAELAATALHEAFHVYQRAHHKDWSGNEGDLLLYPTDDAKLLAWRRQETEALRRALATRSKTDSACWARVAMSARRERFAAMDSNMPRYERATELNEGLATYVERYALYYPAEFPANEFDAEAVRKRVYTVGPAIAYLLDRFSPDWKESLERNDKQYLDQMLVAALGTAEAATHCGFGAEELADIEARAKSDAGAVVAKRKTKREQFDAQKGWRVIVETDSKRPLWPNQFDPLNMERVEGGLLHTRWVVLNNDYGKMEALDGENADITVFTKGPGPHPLFNGVTRVVVVVGAKPDVDVWGEHRVEVKAPGFKIRVEKATMHEDEREVRIQLGK